MFIKEPIPILKLTDPFKLVLYIIGLSEEKNSRLITPRIDVINSKFLEVTISL